MAGDLNLQRLNEWIDNLLKQRGKDIFRSKGILSIAGKEEKFVFQGIHMIFDGVVSDVRWAPGEARVNRMIFIGRNLDRNELENGFRSCLCGEDSNFPPYAWGQNEEDILL